MRVSRAAVCVLALAVGGVACDEPTPPPVAQREPSLEPEDIAVMSALFDDFRRDWAEKVSDGSAPRFVVVDTTMTMCPRDPPILGPQPGRCLDPRSVNVVLDVVPAGLTRMVVSRLPVWMAKPLLISGPLGDGVTLVSPTLLDSTGPGELLRRYRTAVLSLSAIGYLARGMAVILMSDTGGTGAARLEQQPDGRWRVAARVNRPIDSARSPGPPACAMLGRGALDETTGAGLSRVRGDVVCGVRAAVARGAGADAHADR